MTLHSFGDWCLYILMLTSAVMFGVGLTADSLMVAIIAAANVIVCGFVLATRGERQQEETRTNRKVDMWQPID